MFLMYVNTSCFETYSNLKVMPSNKHVWDFGTFFLFLLFFFFLDMHSNQILWWFQTRLRNVQFSVACACFVFPALIFASVYSLLQSKSWF